MTGLFDPWVMLAAYLRRRNSSNMACIEAWCIVFMLRYFFWAINTKFKNIIITDHAALPWMDNMVKHHSLSHRQLVRFSLEINQSGPHILKHLAGAIHVVPDAISRLVATDTSIDRRRDRANIESPHPNIWQDCLFIRECSNSAGSRCTARYSVHGHEMGRLC
jgi:hypothetical protein